MLSGTQIYLIIMKPQIGFTHRWYVITGKRDGIYVPMAGTGFEIGRPYALHCPAVVGRWMGVVTGGEWDSNGGE